MSDAPELLPLPYTAEQLDQQWPEWRTALVDGYRWMVLGRALDRRMLGLQRQGRVGFYGPATGQEAVSIGVALALRSTDWVFPGLREQLLMLARGHPMGTYVDHLFANDRDPARGRQMPCHPTGRDVRYVSMSSVIGTQISQAVGVAYGLKLRQESSVSLAFFGDGATSSNDFHAGLNFAAVFQLPVLFCCTNNQWAISVPVDRQSHVKELAQKAVAYGLPGHRVDGTDLVAVHLAVRDALGRIRSGTGPELLEFVLYRMTPHSSSDDPTRYQAGDWATQARVHDPVPRVEALLETLGALSDPLREEIATTSDNVVRAAIADAESVPQPDPASLFTDVYAPRGPGAG
ncbi:MAG: thiamine pyrophosphate-dependent enzyme [Thermoplasmata archaeon]|nr:thiamine pyrophosphate-dependent enzyme [Thermoplasmata archaeon]